MPGVNIALPCAAYTGDQPFAFISYAHLDAEAVYPEIQRLDLMGYRVWYDEGIDPGNEWPEEVASALKRCAQFIVFVTQRAIGSRNVRNEINYALKLSKPFFAIHLDETELPPGMDLQMSSIQAILKWRMNEQTYVRNLERALPRTFGVPATREESVPSVAPRAPVAGRPPQSGLVEVFARTLHSDFQTNMKRGERQNWHQLAEDAREQFLVQSQFLLSMLHIAGYNVANANDDDKPHAFSPDVLDLLARLEHDRWSRERIDAGWRFAERTDVQNRRTPYLLPWSGMQEQIRQYDREAVRRLPDLLLKTGYAITSLYTEPERKSLFQLANQGSERTGAPLRGSPSAQP